MAEAIANSGATGDAAQCLAPPPELSDRASEVIALMRLGNRQMRLSMSGVVGFDWPAFEMLAQKAGIETDILWWELFALAEGEFCAIMNKPAEKTADE